ncbi:flagellar export protein FliJ [Sporosarcina sp. CAU 1771]
MKAYNYRFEKVLAFREQEKVETESEYKNTVDAFEAVATDLYELLKQKENTISKQQAHLETGSTINEIHYYVRFIESLEKNIHTTQQKVIQARSKMNWYEDKLLERTIEVKKFEKMKENDRENYRTEMEYREAGLLDELSTLKFRGRENGW